MIVVSVVYTVGREGSFFIRFTNCLGVVFVIAVHDRHKEGYDI